MKTLSEYLLEYLELDVHARRINEAYDVFRLNEVTVKYDVVPENYIVQAPETYTEDNLTLYMSDKLFNNVPSSADNADKFFGTNAESIFDIYFEYDGFEHNGQIDNETPDLEWDAHYDKNINSEIDLKNFKFKKLKYVMKFDRFDIQYGKEDKVPETLKEIFMATVSNNVNKYSLELKLDPKNIEYSK